MKVIYLISIIKSKLTLHMQRSVLDFNNICSNNLSLKVNSVTEIHFAKVNKIVFSYKRFDRFYHSFDVKVVFHKKVLVRTLFTPVSCIEVFFYWLTSQNPNVFWQNRIQHFTIIELLF
jgi:hypothetical protein